LTGTPPSYFFYSEYTESYEPVAEPTYYYQYTTYAPAENVGGWENGGWWNAFTNTPYYYNEETQTYEYATPDVETEQYYYETLSYEPIVGGQGATAAYYEWLNQQETP
jgi:hypothetical protein